MTEVFGALGETVRLLPHYLAQHVLLCASALGLALVICLPASVAATRAPRLRAWLLGFSGTVQTVPALALMALFYPLLLALSAASEAMGGPRTPALGFLPALLALTLYAMLPLLRNAIVGLVGVDPAMTQAAKGVGMTPRQSLFLVEIPLAAPVMMAGVRTAAVWTIGAATLATPVGQTSLGNYIFVGLQTENWFFVLFGCLVSAALALVADALLGMIESGVASRSRWRVLAGLAGLALGVGAAIAPSFGAATNYRIGAKGFSEQFILAELIADRLRATGASARVVSGLGSAVAFRALASGDIDVYVDYSGTLWTNVLGRSDAPPREAMNAELTRALRNDYGVVVAGRLGFENAYALVMKRARAQALGVSSIDDLASRAPSLAIGADLEFLSRPEWAGLRDAYGLRFREARSFAPTFMYRALTGGEVDVISGFSSDGRIAAYDLVTLSDPRGAIPAYDALVLVAPERADDARLARALKPLLGAIDVTRMRQANLMVDRDENKVSPRAAARWLAEQTGVARQDLPKPP